MNVREKFVVGICTVLLAVAAISTVQAGSIKDSANVKSDAIPRFGTVPVPGYLQDCSNNTNKPNE